MQQDLAEVLADAPGGQVPPSGVRPLSCFNSGRRIPILFQQLYAFTVVD
jgi:hypothetical protein